MKAKSIALMLIGIMLVGASTTFAQELNFQKVTGRICDGNNQPPLEGERIVLLESNSLFGLGYQDKNNCNVVDFHSYVITSSGITNGVKSGQMQVVDETAFRKSTCTQGVVTVPVQFRHIELNGSKITLLGGSNCKKLELLL